MKPFVMLVAACILMFSAEVRAQDGAAEDQYFDVYTLILKGDTLSAKGKPEQARTNYLKADVALKKLQEDHPLWNTTVVRFRLDYLNSKLTEPAASVKKPANLPAPAKKPDLSQEMAIPGDTAEPVMLKIKWDVGKRYQERLTLGLDGQVTAPGQPQPMKGAAKLSQEASISALKERDGGGRDLQLEFGDTFLDLKQDGKTVMSYDSKNPSPDDAANPLAPTLKPLKGARLTFVTDGSGKVESVEGLEDFIKTVGGPAAGDPAALLKSMPTNMAMMGTMQTNSSFLPDHPVKVGDTWSSTAETPAGLGVPGPAFAGSMNYTFKGWSQHDGHKCVVIDFTGTVAPKTGDAPAAGTSPMDVQANIPGTIWFDPELGMPVEISANPDFNLKMDLMGPMSVKVNLQADYKLVEVADIVAAK